MLSTSAPSGIGTIGAPRASAGWYPHGSEGRTITPTVHDRWTSTDRLLLLAVFGAGLVVRSVLLGVEGFRDDMDQFAQWIAHIQVAGLGQLYTENAGGPVTFGPVMGYLWWFLGMAQPAFASATDAAHPLLNTWMKVPASVADFGMAAVVAWALRERPRWAIASAAAVLLVPVTWYVSAWWGQYESIYVLPALAGVVAATRGRNALAAALFAVALATKPQAIPLILPFIAWCWAHGGLRGTLRSAFAGALTFGLLWLPFLPAGGPIAYLSNLAYYQNEVFDVLSARAWNPWLLIQEVAAGGTFIADDVPIAGPLTLRVVGYGLTAALSIVLMAAVLRDPRPRTLTLATAASALVFFIAMTQMHERYSYAAVIIGVLALPELRVRLWWCAVTIVVTLNLLVADPVTNGLAIPTTESLGVIGAIVLTGLTAWLVREVAYRRDQ